MGPRHVRRAQPYTAPKVYVNYLADDDNARVADAYGPNLERLVELKRRYDPDNLFHLNQNNRARHHADRRARPGQSPASRTPQPWPS